MLTKHVPEVSVRHVALMLCGFIWCKVRYNYNQKACIIYFKSY